MRLLELTDGVNDTEAKEYADVDSIARIEPFEFKEEIYEKETQSVGFLWNQRTEEVSVYKGKKVRTGSILYMKGKGRTFVKESPQQIIEMIKNKQFTLEI